MSDPNFPNFPIPNLFLADYAIGIGVFSSFSLTIGGVFHSNQGCEVSQFTQADFTPSVNDLSVVLAPSRNPGLCSSLGNMPSAGSYSGKAVLILRGGCPFEEKAVNAMSLGAAAVIIALKILGEPVWQMGASSYSVYDTITCQASRTFYDLVSTANSQGKSVIVNMSNIAAYKEELEYPSVIPENLPSYFDIVSPPQFTYTYPTGWATWNKLNMPAVSGNLIYAIWRPECIVTWVNTFSQLETQCTSCWALPSPYANVDALRGNIAVFDLLFLDYGVPDGSDRGPWCQTVFSYAIVAKKAEEAGAVRNLVSSLHVYFECCDVKSTFLY